MSSKIRETRMRQKTEAESVLESRVAKLKEAGHDDQKMAKDPKLRKLKADLKKVNIRLKAIDAKDAVNEALAQKRATPEDQPKSQGAEKSQGQAQEIQIVKKIVKT